MVDENDLWIFGYGSLVWKADFPYVEKKTGYIKGFFRRFYQNSTDHRGTNEKPGRVVTLIPANDSETKVWGMAYKIMGNDKEKVLNYLDFREKDGYTRCSVQFYPQSFPGNENKIDILLYMATEDNEFYAGDSASIEEIAKQMFYAVGDSGTNREYVYRLAETFRRLYPDENDEHLFAIEKTLKTMEVTKV